MAAEVARVWPPHAREEWEVLAVPGDRAAKVRIMEAAEEVEAMVALVVSEAGGVARMPRRARN